MGRKTKSERLRVWWNDALLELYGIIPEQHHFVLSSGESIANLKELAAALPKMSPEVFAHHVNEHKNDFANWAHDIFKERTLAEDLAKVDEKRDAELVLVRHLHLRLESLSERLVKKA